MNQLSLNSVQKTPPISDTHFTEKTNTGTHTHTNLVRQKYAHLNMYLCKCTACTTWRSNTFFNKGNKHQDIVIRPVQWTDDAINNHLITCYRNRHHHEGNSHSSVHLYFTEQNELNRALQETKSKLFRYHFIYSSQISRILTLTTEIISHPFSVRDTVHINMADALQRITSHQLIIFHNITSDTPLISHLLWRMHFSFVSY